MMKQPSSDLPPKICFTASACLIHNGKVLLVKHKKAKIWLKPGGHIEPDELPHHAAEREMLEETGVKVKAKKYGFMPEIADPKTEFLPGPFNINLHWVSEKNYDARVANPDNYQIDTNWKKDCEQHYNLDFFVEPVGSLEYSENKEESDGIGWFGPDEIDDLETTEDIKNELKYAFTVVNQ